MRKLDGNIGQRLACNQREPGPLALTLHRFGTFVRGLVEQGRGGRQILYDQQGVMSAPRQHVPDQLEGVDYRRKLGVFSYGSADERHTGSVPTAPVPVQWQ